MISKVTVVGQLVGANGKAIAGALVTAELSEAIHNGSDSINPTLLSTRTSATGVFQFSLAANTDEGTFPAGSFHTVKCAAAGLESEVVVQPATGLVQFTSLPPAPSAAGEVASVFGRTGAVVAKTGDYTAAQVTDAALATGGTIAPAVFVIPTAASAPGSPVADQAYFDSVKEEIGVYSGGKWVYTGKLV